MLEAIDGIEVDLGLLPPELADCVPLIRRFAIGDDVVRSERMEAATVSELEALAHLSPAQWAALERYLDEHMERPGTPEQDVALVLSAFGEAAVEARFDLEARRDR
jgi:hypothetical protein